MSRVNLIAVLGVLALGALVPKAAAQTTGDYRSTGSGNWETVGTWQTWNGSSWVAASVQPTSANNVFIQAAHTVTLTASGDVCSNLNLSDGTTSANGSTTSVALGANTLMINGALEEYFGAVNTTAGSTAALSVTATTTLPATPISITASSAGEIQFIGNSRTILATGTWASGNTGSTTTYATEIKLNNGQIATVQTVFKTSGLTVTSGTLSTVQRIGISDGTAGQGNVTIASGAVLASSISGTAAGDQIVSESTSGSGAVRAGTLTINSGGILQVSGATPCMDMNSLVLNGTIVYSGGAQTLLQPSGIDSSAATFSNYGNLTVSASGAKTLVSGLNITVNGTVALTNGTLVVGANTLILDGLAIAGTATNLTTTSSSSLSFGGSFTGVTLPANATALNNLTINNANGVTLSGNLTLGGTLTLTSGALAVGANVFTLNGPAISVTSGSLSTTSASTLIFGGSAAGVSVPSSVTALNNLIIGNSSGVTLNAAPTIATALEINSGDTLALNYAGTANVGLLTFNNGAAWQTAGTYGFTGSGATTIDTTHFATSSTLGTVTVGAGTPSSAQLQYRSDGTGGGNWETTGTWQTSVDFINWGSASAMPVSGNNVYIQAGDTVTLTASGDACSNLNLSTGTTAADTGGDGVVALGANILSVNGYLRAYYGVVGGSENLPGTATTTFGSGVPITMTAASAGEIQFVGNTRSIFNTGGWSSGYAGGTTTFATAIALNSGQTATAQTVFKTSALTIVSGTLSTSLRVGIDNGTTGAGGGSVTIASGAVWSSSATGKGAGQQVLSQGTSTRAGTLTINGTLQLGGATPSIDMNSFVLGANGTVVYNGGAQTLLQISGLDSSAAAFPTYVNLTLSGTAADTLAVNTTVSGTLTMAGTASLALGGNTLTYGGSSTLTYAGAAAQATTDNEFPPVSGGPNSVTINNPDGVSLNDSKTISGTLTVNSGTTLNFNSQTLTAGATALNGTLTMEVNQTAPGTFTGSQLIQSSGTLTYGGTLNLTATGSALANGDAPVLSSASGYGGAFTVTNLPALPSNLYWYSGKLTNNGSIIINSEPVVSGSIPSYAHLAGIALIIPVSSLTNNWSDADGNPLTLTGTVTSTNGASVTHDGNFIYYPANDVADQLAYTIEDGYGGTASGLINVTISAAATAPSVGNPAINGNGHPTFGGNGIPGYSYGVESETTLTGPWSEAGTVTSGSNGQWSFTDTNQTDPATIFYRLYYPDNPGNPPQ